MGGGRPCPLSLPFPKSACVVARSTPPGRRGIRYLESGAVLEVVWREGTLTAWVEGSEIRPYHVRVRFNEQGEIEEAFCSCPYEGDGDCKHIVAALLVLIRHPEKVSVRPALRTLLEGRSREQLIDLLQFLADRYPETLEAMEAFLTAPAPPPAEQPAEVNLAALRDQIRTTLRRIARGAYQAYPGDEGWPVPSGALDPALRQARSLLDRGEPRAALLVLETAVTAWIEGGRLLDPDLLQILADIEQEEGNLEALAEVWTEALLSADLSVEERRAWERKLESWMKTMIGEDALAMPLTAVRQGWDDPRLLAVMTGDARRVWEGERPPFADDLAQVRLRILRARGRYEEAIRLAKAEGQTLLYLQLLAEAGKGEQAAREARRMLQDPYEVLILARILTERGEIDLGLELGAHGLTLGDERRRVSLAEWLHDQAESHGRLDLARRAAWEAFKARPTAENYLRLKACMGEEWESHRRQALDLLAAHASSPDRADEAIEIYLLEKRYPEAMALVEKHPGSSKLEKVVEAVRDDYPDWAFARCYRRAAEIMDSGRSADYETAIAWLRRGRDILLRSGQAERWQAVLDELLRKHQRKHKLKPMLEGLR
jgi:uncharacterized Zn finger protein